MDTQQHWYHNFIIFSLFRHFPFSNLFYVPCKDLLWKESILNNLFKSTPYISHTLVGSFLSLPFPAPQCRCAVLLAAGRPLSCNSFFLTLTKTMRVIPSISHWEGASWQCPHPDGCCFPWFSLCRAVVENWEGMGGIRSWMVGWWDQVPASWMVGLVPGWMEGGIRSGWLDGGIGSWLVGSGPGQVDGGIGSWLEGRWDQVLAGWTVGLGPGWTHVVAATLATLRWLPDNGKNCAPQEAENGCRPVDFCDF